MCNRGSKRIDYTNMRFNSLVACRYSHLAVRNTYWIFKCDCGEEKPIRIADVKSGKVKSCGCIHKIGVVTHGLTNNRLYNIWRGMKYRCYNSLHPKYKYYGGRGIIVYDEWMHSPQAFIDWSMNTGYNSTLEIDRIDNDGNYEPSNCRWVTHKENCNNKRNNKHVKKQISST